MSEVCMILAVGPKNEEGKHLIGIGNKLAWHSKKDLEFFKQTTNTYPCLFGSATFFGLPKYPLPNRVNVVLDISYPKTYDIINLEYGKGFALVVNSLEKAISAMSNYDKIFICGGASIYKYALEKDLVDRIYVTFVDSDDKIEGDVYLNIENFDEILEEKWKCISKRDEVDEKSNLNLSFNEFIKK